VRRDLSLLNIGASVADVAAVIIPSVPAGAGCIARIGKAAKARNQAIARPGRAVGGNHQSGIPRGGPLRCGGVREGYKPPRRVCRGLRPRQKAVLARRMAWEAIGPAADGDSRGGTAPPLPPGPSPSGRGRGKDAPRRGRGEVCLLQEALDLLVSGVAFPGVFAAISVNRGERAARTASPKLHWLGSELFIAAECSHQSAHWETLGHGDLL
jgi:hypothetical protein